MGVWLLFLSCDCLTDNWLAATSLSRQSRISCITGNLSRPQAAAMPREVTNIELYRTLLRDYSGGVAGRGPAGDLSVLGPQAGGWQRRGARRQGGEGGLFQILTDIKTISS